LRYSIRIQAPWPPEGIPVVATYHPSALLRVPAQEDKEAMRKVVLADLQRALSLAEK